MSSPLAIRVNGHGHSPLANTVTKAALPLSGNSSETSVHVVKNLPGYTTPEFKGKREQSALVEAEVMAKVRSLHPLSSFPSLAMR